jgi:HK97 family phage portal protein
MNFFQKIITQFLPSTEQRAINNSHLWEDITTGTSSSGELVNESTAMRVSAVYACVRVIAESVASLSVDVYAKDSDGSRDKVNSELANLLKVQPNDDMSAYSFLEAQTAAAVLTGNSYTQIVRAVNGKVKALRPLSVKNVQVRQEESTGRIYFLYQNVRFEQDEIIHIMGPTKDGLLGMNPIELAREAMGLSLSAEKHGASYFDNAFSPGGTLSFPQPISADAKRRISEALKKNFSGANAGKVAIFDNGAKFDPVSLSNQDAQFLETRKFQVSEIARMFRVPPHMIGDLERATFSNVEQQGIDFVVYTLRPWLRRWEDELNRKLLKGSGRFIEFNVSSLLRGDTASRFSAYAVGRQNGWLSANDIRALENMNPIEGGDIYLTPMNMTPSDKVEDLVDSQIDSTSDDGSTKDSQDVARAFHNAMSTALERCRLKAIPSMKKEDFDIETFEGRHQKYVKKALEPVFQLGSDLGVTTKDKITDVAEMVVRNHIFGFGEWAAGKDGTLEEVLEDIDNQFNSL